MRALAFLLAVLLAPAAPALTMDQLLVHGRLGSAGGVAVDGNYNFTLSLFADKEGGDPLWADAVYDVPVTNGIFTAVIGKTKPLPAQLLADNDQLWVQAKVDNDPPLSRVRLYPAAAALIAKAAATLQCSGCITPAHTSFLTGCDEGQVLAYSGGTWGCGDAGDTKLTEEEVDAFVANNGYALSGQLKAVALSGSYDDLIDTPALAAVALSGSYNDLTDKPVSAIATVASAAEMEAITTPGTIVYRSDVDGFYARTSTQWKPFLLAAVCGNGVKEVGEECDDGNTTSGDSCDADCTVPKMWMESAEVRWYPIKYPDSTWSESKGVATCKAAGYRLWRDEGGALSDPSYVYDTNNTHNLGGHDIGYKVNNAVGGAQESHTGTWLIFDKAWSESIKSVSGASDGQTVYILNKKAHTSTYETEASYTKVTPNAASVSYQGAANEAISGMSFAIVLCSNRK